MKKTIEKLSLSNLDDFSTLFNNDECEKCQCTFYFKANDIDQWMNMNIKETKELRKDIDDSRKNEKLHTGYKNLFEYFGFDCIGNNNRYYFMKKVLNSTNKS